MIYLENKQLKLLLAVMVCCG